MSARNQDSAGVPASPMSEGAPGPGASTGAPNEISDKSYTPAILKGEIKLTKLNSDNYQRWAEGMQLLLAAKRLWRLVSGLIKMPDPKTRPVDHEAWNLDDDQAKAWIYVNLEDSQHNHIRGSQTSHEMWEALRKVHGALGQGRLNFLKRKFFNLKAGPTDSIDDVASELSRLQLKIRGIKATEAPTDLDVALTLINSVDDEAYALMKFHLDDMENLTLAHTKERLKSVEQRIRDDSTNDEKANKSGTTPRKEDRECFFCKRKGHLKRKCFKWLETDEGKKYAEDHPQPEKSTKTGQGKKPAPGGARAAQEEGESGDDAFMAREDHALAAEHLPPPDMWIIDSGATRHMTPNRSLFTTIQPINTRVTVASGEMLRAHGIGEVKVSLGGHITRMKEVLHVPGLDANLLSISALGRRGFNVLFNKGVVDIRSGNTSVATGIMKGRMYLLRSSDRALLTSEVHKAAPEAELEATSGAAPVSETSTSGTTKSGNSVGAPPIPENSVSSKQGGIQVMNADQKNFWLWHERFGHVGPARLRSLGSHVSGMKAIELPDQLACEICDFSKFTRKINRETPRRASRRLGRVHTDVWAPFKTPSLGGNRYFLSLIDDLTRKSWISCMKARSDVYQKFQQWRDAINLETGETAATLRSDNAREYQKLEKMVQTQGTKMEFTTAYTPERIRNISMITIKASFLRSHQAKPIFFLNKNSNQPPTRKPSPAKTRDSGKSLLPSS